jgi:hypothetical protein
MATKLNDKQVKLGGSFSLDIHWVPGHKGLKENETADQQAKQAARGHQSHPDDLPQLLHKPLPLSASAAKAATKKSTSTRWNSRWRTSRRFKRMRTIDPSPPSHTFLSSLSNTPRNTSSLIVQLRTGHIALNHHLHKIGKSISPDCPGCGPGNPETIDHILLACPMYRSARKTLRDRFGRKSHDAKFLLNNPHAFSSLASFFRNTGRLPALQL